MRSAMSLLRRLAIEPPFRILARQILALLPCSIDTRAMWDLSARPHYLAGVLFAVQEARRRGIPEISVIEFGVASGAGLIVLQREAEAVEQATGVSIRVFGFDAGPGGLPTFCGDYRDHPDMWMPGDFPMDVGSLRTRLAPRTTLVLGNVRDTVKGFRENYNPAPIGFMAMDLDLYSSTAIALSVLDLCPILRHVAMYFDDINFTPCHQWAGELLAIDEFNNKYTNLKIDRWRCLRYDRPFPEKPWIDHMFFCHDLEAISKCESNRQPQSKP